MPHNWSPGDYAMVITAIFTGLFTGICSVIAAIKATRSDNKSSIVVQKADINGQKLDDIHVLTNGNLSRTQEELTLAKKRLSFLEKVLAEVADKCTPGVIDTAKRRVEERQAVIGKRRREDLENSRDEVIE
jgi:hypothetical protein